MTMQTETNGTPANGAAMAKVPATPAAMQVPPTAAEQEWALLQRQAKAFAGSDLVPKNYQGNLPNCVIAVQLAHRLGADPLMVMQNLDIIHGRPGWRSTFLIATVNQSGKFSPIRYRFVGKEGTNEWGCRAHAKDLATGDECVGALITIALAKAEGWESKAGSKWKTMPEQMLMYRAAAFWTRTYAPELSLGMQTTDELQDAGDYAPPTVTQTNTTRRNAAPVSDIDAEFMETPAPKQHTAEIIDPMTGEVTPTSEGGAS
jgi:hypothetical protein